MSDPKLLFNQLYLIQGCSALLGSSWILRDSELDLSITAILCREWTLIQEFRRFWADCRSSGLSHVNLTAYHGPRT